MELHTRDIAVSHPKIHPGSLEKHPKGTQARILLSSVFGPYAQDDEFGSRSINPMELYHNQVTRAQGSFSLRMFHRSWGIMMIQANISAPCAVLDFPTRGDFAQQLKNYHYDVVGITGIIVNVAKVREMCRMTRELSPESVIVVGGHVAPIPGIETMIDADHIVKGEGVLWMRRYLGEDESAPLRHPAIGSGMRTRIMGIRMPERKGATAATIIPSVGCNFCTTSAFFGGKGKFVNFFETGDELFEVMSRMEDELKVNSFFVMDENFLLHRERAMRLLELMKEWNKSWAMSVFASSQRDPQVYDAGTGGTGRVVAVDGAGISTGRIQQAAGSGHASTHTRIARAWHSCAGIVDHRAGASHAG